MGYWVSLCDPKGEALPVPSHKEGGVVNVDGADVALMSVTYNYAPFFSRELDQVDGLRWLHGKKGSQTEQRMREAITNLGFNRDPNYWAPTPGNAGHILKILLGWAVRHPEGIWAVH